MAEQQFNDFDENEIDLLELLGALRRHLVLIVVCTMIFGIVAGVVTKCLITPMYSSTSEIYILSSSTSITSLTDIQIGTQLTHDYEEMIQSRPIIDEVIATLHLNRSYSEVLSQITISNPSNTRIIKITVQDADPQLAKDMADAFANVSAAKLSEIMKTDAPSIAQYGYVPEYPVSPSLKKNVAIGALGGAVLACIYAVIIFILDDSVKNPDDVLKYLGLNTLASIPLKEEEKKTRKPVKRFARKGGNNNAK